MSLVTFHTAESNRSTELASVNISRSLPPNTVDTLVAPSNEAVKGAEETITRGLAQPFTGTPSSDENWRALRRPLETAAPSTETRDLHTRLARFEDRQESLLASAAGDEVAMFILSKIITEESLDTDSLARCLRAPAGWISFARLWRADLIAQYGGTVVPTAAGLDLMEWFSAHMLTPEQIPAHA